MHGIDREVLEISIERDGDAFCRRQCPAMEAPIGPPSCEYCLPAPPPKDEPILSVRRGFRSDTIRIVIALNFGNQVLHADTQSFAERVKC